MKYGEYIRTNSGYIGKLKRIEFDEIDKFLKWYVYDKKEPNINIIKEVYINKPYIVNHSKNIIDLIQVGDYVNGKLCIDIEEIITDDGRRNLNLVCLGGNILELSHEIDSILTKEQYEQNVFKVVE